MKLCSSMSDEQNLIRVIVLMVAHARDHLVSTAIG